MIDIMDENFIENYIEPISEEYSLPVESEALLAPEEAASDEVDTVSENEIDYSLIIDELNTLNENIERSIEKDDRIIELLKRTSGPDSVSGSDLSDGDIEYVTSVSDNNIMTKAINDYTVEESLLFSIALFLIIFGVVALIRKGLPQWR